MSTHLTPVHPERFLEMPAMIGILRERFDAIDEPRSRKRPTLYGLLGDAPSDSTLRRRLDLVDPHALRPAFSALWQAADRATMLRPLKLVIGFTPIAIDGSGQVESMKVHCDRCLVQEKEDGVHYSHKVVLAAAVSVNVRHAIPLAYEPIVNGDGECKQHCESKAATRLVEHLRDDFPTIKPLMLADALQSTGPMVKRFQAHDMDFIVKVKDPGHTALFDKAFDAPQMQTETVADRDDKELEHEFHWCDDVPLNASNPDVLGTLVSWTVTRVEPDVGKTEEKRRGWEKTESWFTSLRLGSDGVGLLGFMRLARTRWSIEYEAFNVLKNHGMNMGHNYGHGKCHLVSVLFGLMLLAWALDTLWGMTAPIALRARARHGSWKSVWQAMRILVRYVEVDGWETLYAVIADERKVTLSTDDAR